LAFGYCGFVTAAPAAGAVASSAVPIATAVTPPKIIPSPPDFDAKSYILMDANSGYVIAEKNSSLRASPASITKVMSLYLIAKALRSGQIHLNDQVTVSENAWRTGGSRMFIRVGTNVVIEDLIKGMVVASGNDATVAMAEHLAGTEQAFANLMNQEAHNLKMNNTNYIDASGLHDDNYSTAFDLATLASAWTTNLPEYYPWFKEKWMVYNNIRQPNRNRLLWRDASVDGIKTGHTNEAGYCLIASAIRNGMRLVTVVMGAKNDSVRANNSMALLSYGFRFFETHKLFAANTSIATPKVWFGKEGTVALGSLENLYVTLPAGQHKNVKASAIINPNLKAPIVKGQSYGVINILLEGKVISTKPLVALKDNPRANFLFVGFDYIRMLFSK
jgi:serine-type D-Ala-D-Ala carboxypeptidase (penicillin-binding protein 5/6)